jgi:putative transposase
VLIAQCLPLWLLCLARPESRRSRENRILENKIRLLHAASHGIYGAPKIHQDLVDDGVRCGKNRVARIMRKAGIRSRAKKKFKATTNSKHKLPVAPNILNQDFTVDAPDRAWVADITYICTPGRLVVSGRVGRSVQPQGNRLVCLLGQMTRQLAIDALQMALDRRNTLCMVLFTTRTGAANTPQLITKNCFPNGHYLQYEPQGKLLR